MSRLSKEETMSARLMSVKELSGVLPLSVNTLYCWVSQRRISLREVWETYEV